MKNIVYFLLLGLFFASCQPNAETALRGIWAVYETETDYQTGRITEVVEILADKSINQSTATLRRKVAPIQFEGPFFKWQKTNGKSFQDSLVIDEHGHWKSKHFFVATQLDNMPSPTEMLSNSLQNIALLKDSSAHNPQTFDAFLEENPAFWPVYLHKEKGKKRPTVIWGTDTLSAHAFGELICGLENTEQNKLPFCLFADSSLVMGEISPIKNALCYFSIIPGPSPRSVYYAFTDDQNSIQLSDLIHVTDHWYYLNFEVCEDRDTGPCAGVSWNVRNLVSDSRYRFPPPPPAIKID